MLFASATEGARAGWGRLGLPQRAVLFVAGLVVTTGVLAVVAIAFGFNQEVSRYQVYAAERFAGFVAKDAGLMVSSGQAPALARLTERAQSHADMRTVAVYDEAGRLLSQSGEREFNPAALIASAQGEHRVQTQRLGDGSIAVVQPFPRESGARGFVFVRVPEEGFRAHAFPVLAPFLAFLGALLLVAMPLSVWLVRRSIAPLGELARFAENLAAGRESKPLMIRTGDEFETLARAFNQMIEKQTATLRRLQQIAFVDPVTQLPNQDRLQRELDIYILHADPENDIAAVIVFDFEALAPLMQTLDPSQRRDLLRCVAERFSSAVQSFARPRDGVSNISLARIGASEFAAFAPGLKHPSDAARLAQHMMSALNQNFFWNGHTLSLSPSCGAALAPRDGKDADAVLRHARMALSVARKTVGRAKMFSASLDRQAVSRLHIEREVRAGLARGEFRAFFQPKVNAKTGRIEAAEALARWLRPNGMIVSPGRFIPVAEESGLIEPLSDAIMRESCWKAAAWARAGHPISVAVNVSALQFRKERFAEHVLQIIHHAGLPPHLLELELTESIALENPERAKRQIEPLRAVGVRFAIDDFGCGHSSLAALSKLPFDVIKIDQQFLHGLKRDEPASVAIIEMILALANSLHLDVVAEGVERPDQAEFIASRGCRWAQGFLYGAAVSPLEFGERLAAQAAEQAEAPHRPAPALSLHGAA